MGFFLRVLLVLPEMIGLGPMFRRILFPEKEEEKTLDSVHEIIDPAIKTLEDETRELRQQSDRLHRT